MSPALAEPRRRQHVDAFSARLPLVGTAMTGVLWSFLHREALVIGLSWAAVGVVYAVMLSRLTGRRLSDVELVDERHDDAAPELVPV